MPFLPMKNEKLRIESLKLYVTCRGRCLSSSRKKSTKPHGENQFRSLFEGAVILKKWLREFISIIHLFYSLRQNLRFCHLPLWGRGKEIRCNFKFTCRGRCLSSSRKIIYNSAHPHTKKPSVKFKPMALIFVFTYWISTQSRAFTVIPLKVTGASL